MPTIAILESPHTTPSLCLHCVSSHGGGEGKPRCTLHTRSFDTVGEIRGVVGRPCAPSVPRRYIRHARTHTYTRGCFLSHSTSRRLKRQRTKMKSLSARERTGCCSPPHLSPNGTDARQPARHHRAPHARDVLTVVVHVRLGGRFQTWGKGLRVWCRRSVERLAKE